MYIAVQFFAHELTLVTNSSKLTNGLLLFIAF